MMSNKKFIKFIVIAVVILLAVFAVYRLFIYTEPIPDEEAKKILTELLPKAYEINDVVWGEGLPVAEGQNPPLITVTGAQYRLVSEDAPYHSTEQLRKAICEVYSEDYVAQTIDYFAFKGDEGALEAVSDNIYPRYSDNDAGQLLINITSAKRTMVPSDIDISTAKVVSAKGNKHTVEVKENYEGKVITRTFVLVDQDDGWRLDSMAY